MNEAFLKKYQVDLDNQSITFSCATELPCQRYDEENNITYQEILIINENSVDLDRLNKKAPLLFNHDTNKLIGVVEKAWIQNERVLVRVRFSQNDQFSKRVFADIIDGIIAGISIGYTIEDYKDVKQDGINKRYVTRFMIYQVSAVSIPADTDCTLRNFNNKGKKSMKKNCDKLEEKEKEIEIEKEQVIEEKQPEQQEIKDDEKDAEIDALKAENEALKIEIEKLKEQEQKPEEIEVEKETIDEDNNRKEMEKIAEDFNVEKEQVERAISNKLTIREFKSNIRNKNINIEVKNTMNNSKRDFQDYLKARNFDQPFTLRDFTGFGGKTGENGASLIGTDTIELIPALEKIMGVKGFRTLSGLHYNVSIPVQTGRNTIYQTADLRTAATTSNPEFTNKVLTPVKLSGNTVIGTELIVQADANQDVVGFVISSLQKQIAYKLQDFMLSKVIAANPTEINYSALSAIDWDDILAFEAATGAYALNDLAFVMSPSARAVLKGTPKTANYPAFLCEDNQINGYDCRVSGCVTNDNIYFGDWSKLILGVFGEGLDILVNPYKYSTEGMIEVTASIAVDAVVEQTDAFALGKVQDSSSSSAESSSSQE